MRTIKKNGEMVMDTVIQLVNKTTGQFYQTNLVEDLNEKLAMGWEVEND